MKKMIICSLLCFSQLFAETAKLNVQGEATLKKPADQAVVSIGVVTEALSAREAVDANSVRMEKVMTTLQGFGIEKSDYETGQFQVNPQYTTRPKQAPEDWKPQILGYKVVNNLNVTTTLLEELGEILDAAIAAGGNSIGNIQFSLKEPRKHRKEAITKAAQNAMQDARNLAEAAGVQLGRILSLALDQAEVRPLFKAAMRSEGVPIEAGDVDVHASVTITYELQ